MRLWILAAALLGSASASAATVVKCVDAAGKITYAQNECPAGLVGEQHDVKASPRPSGEGPAVKLADPSKTYIKKESRPVRRAAPAQPASQEVAEQPPAPRGGVVRQNANQPCVKWVEQRYSYTRMDKDGRPVGRAGIRKVPVPCN
ncbi:hypothetical protein [Pseudomonas sp. BN515]|uniref:hypothetical protein n=1 Tax=Pseudomonas sp. BN515 TaxID=2567892 RepID=UPI002456E22B|nr:hypothetical protein [Pseudomonas sp. BN515]